MDTAAKYVFAPVLETGYALVGDVSLPTIEVTVDEKDDMLMGKTDDANKKEASVAIIINPDEPLYLPEGRPFTDADLLAGVTAADENGSPIDVTVQDVDGLDKTNPAMRGMAQAYTITYAAVHPVSGEAFIATREAYVTVSIVPLAAVGDFTITTTGGGEPPAGSYDYNAATKVLTIKDNHPMTISGTTTTGTIVVASFLPADLTLNNLNIDVSATYGACAFNITGNSTVNITLQGTNILKSGSNCAGLHVSVGNTVKINGSGSLTAQGHDFSAGIGSTHAIDCGTITINGGIVTANGGFQGAGIGGGGSGNSGGKGGTITINGGTVTATGTYDAKDIGPGEKKGSVGTITITGGSVNPTRGLVSPQPTNGTDPVYLNTLTVGNPNIGNDKSITSLSVDSVSGYGINDVATKDGGKLYLWLPQNSSNAANVSLTAGGTQYTKTWARTGTTETQTLLMPGNAAVPSITTQPATPTTYHKGDTATALWVSANVGDGGTLSYQWYSNTMNNNTSGSSIQGATSAGYSPDTSAVGTTYYYCVVTNTNPGLAGTQTAATTSNVAEVKIIDTPDIADISAPTAVFVGNPLTLAPPAVTDNGDTVTDEGWGISADGNTGWTTFDPTTTNMTYAHNGQYLRYYAANSVGTSYSNAVQITVNKLDLTLSLSCADITYGQAPNPQLSGNLGTGTVTYDYKEQGAPNTDYSTTVPTDAGDYTVRASVAAANTYNAAEAETNFSIDKATPSIVLTASPTGGAYANGSVMLTATLTGVSMSDYPTGNVVFKNGNTVLDTVSLAAGTAFFTWQNVPFGTHTLTAEYAGDNNYESASDSVSGYDIQKKTQAPLVVTGVPAILVYGDSSFTLGTTGGNGSGTVTYTVQSGDAVSVSGDTVTIQKAGAAVIQATKAADGTYNETSVVVTVTVEKATPTIQHNSGIKGTNVGKTLSSLSLKDITTAYGVNGASLSGSFAWENPQAVIQMAEKYSVVFTPEDTNYEAVTFEVYAPNYALRTLTDSKTDISVSGTISEDATLTVADMTLGDDAACDAIRSRMKDKAYVFLLGKDISLTGDFSGKLTLSFPIDAKYNGETVTILHCVNGTLETYTVKVQDGKATFEVDSLSPFAVFANADNTLDGTPQTGDTNTPQTGNTGTPKTGDNSSVALWITLLNISAAGIVLALVWQKKRKSAQ